METKKPLIPLTLSDVVYKTSCNILHVNSLRNKLELFTTDFRKEQRLAVQECKTCFYLRGDRIAMQAFWHWHCHLCGIGNEHQNSAHPKLCMTCAKEHNLCAECTGDIDDNKSREKL